MFCLVGSLLTALVVSVHSVSRPPGIIINPPRDVYYKPGETVMLPCYALGSPKPKYLWKRNLIDFNPSGNDKRIVQLPNSGTLVFNSPEEKDEGMFQCFAKNDFGTSVSVNCNMRVAKLGSFESLPDQIHFVTPGEHYTLPCKVPESVPNANVFWIYSTALDGFEAVNYDKRVSMDREYRLRFTNIIETDDRGQQYYACIAMNNIMRLNVQSHRHLIRVQGSENYKRVDYLWSDPAGQIGRQGETLSMQCIFSGNPTPDVQWGRADGKPLSSNSKLKSFSQILEIENIQPEDAGSYICWATNAKSGGFIATSNFVVRVVASPQWIYEPKDVEIGVGGNVEFGCAAKGVPEPAIKWFINGLELTDPKLKGIKYSRPVSEKLFFSDVKETDNMVIQCNASNNFGWIFSDVYLNVLSEAPEFITPPETTLVSAEGLVVNFSCQTTGKPDPIITWMKDGGQVTGGRFKILVDGTLQIEGAVLADAGQYTCEAKNKFGSTAGSGTLVIRRKTRIEQKPGDLERNAGMDAKFTCSGTTDPEEVKNLRIYWLKDGEEILESDERTITNFQDNSLTVSGTIVRDSGTYTCVATNGLDKAKASAVLTVRDRPDAPVSVTQKDCNKEGHVTIEWMPGSFNNAPVQYYILQYNTTFDPDQWTFGQKVNNSLTKIKFELSSWVTYSFRLIAVNKIGPSPPSSHTARECDSGEALPSYHPKNLRTLGHQRNKLYIEWTPIPQIQHNAEGFIYYLTWLPKGQSRSTGLKTASLNWTVNHIEDTASKPYTPYEITIEARNSVGAASEDAPSIIGYTYEDTPLIVPTDFAVKEMADTFAVFEWKFDRSSIGKVDSPIRGEFKGFKIQFWQINKKSNTIREFDVGPESASNITGNTFTSQVDNMIPNTHLEAVISVKNNFYIGKSSNAIRFKTKPGLPGPVDYFQVKNIGDTHVNLEWSSPLENRGDLVGYDISYQLVNGLELGEMQDREPQITDPYQTLGILSGLIARRKYRVYIYARTLKGRGEEYFIEIFTKKPVTPAIPDFTIANIGSTYINVSWWVNAYLTSGSVIFVEYRKLDGAEWLRTADEVVNTWQKISNLEPGTEYEIRVKATNGFVSIPSSIEEVKTDGNAMGYDLVENIGWFIGVFLSELIIIAAIIIFVLCYKRGMRLSTTIGADYNHQSSAAYSGTYDNTAHINRGPEPKGYNNDYYDDKDNYEYDDGSYNKPPSYASDADKKYPSAPGYGDYNKGQPYNYDDGYGAPADYEEQDYPPQGDYYDGKNNDYYDYDRGDDGYDYDNPDYDNRDYDNYDYNRGDNGYYRGDDGYGRRSGNGQDLQREDQGYDYDSEDTGRRSRDKKPSSTFV